MNDEKKNRKDFIHQVMIGRTNKETLRDYLLDKESTLQYIETLLNCLVEMDFAKIHKAMKALHWTWARWEDEYGCEHHDQTPTIYALRKHLAWGIKESVESIVNKNYGNGKEYYWACGGFEISWRLYDDSNYPEDFDHQVLFEVKFVLESFDNGL